MPQHHRIQDGLFHVTTGTHQQNLLCTFEQIPSVLIDNLKMTRSIQNAKIYAFCILPNHIHLLLHPGIAGLSKFMQSFKKNSARDIASLYGISAFKWKKGYYDERIRDEKQRIQAWKYIHYNPYKHGLVDDFNTWQWSSIHVRDVVDNWETI